ncbi:hypothetical protein T07_11295 [Trichinella nelsoni]|uniref:Uncharacterized protein n=1 Tax=Trichinella nelsoni TaxID=6336 RepID=A0A0V0S1F4_9BILA|nr:hypothetical protein T07_11295 [Trichinella nelsoni]
MEHGQDEHSTVEASSIPEENSSLGIGGGGKIIWKLEKGLKWMRDEEKQKKERVGTASRTGLCFSLYDARASAPNTTPANAAQLAGGESERCSMESEFGGFYLPKIAEMRRYERGVWSTIAYEPQSEEIITQHAQTAIIKFRAAYLIFD